MQSASSAFLAKLKEEPNLLISATLIAIDNEVDENDPLFALVEELVINEWKTLRNTHVNRPRQLLQSIMIHTLATIIEANPMAAGIIWNTAVSPYRHGQVRFGKAVKILESLLTQTNHIAEAEAVSRFGLAVPVRKKQRSKKSTSEVISFDPKTTVSDQDLLKDVGRAVGPQYPGQSLSDPNPNWPNNAQQWSQEFTPRMTEALVKAVNLGTQRLANSLSESLTSSFSALEKRLIDRIHQVEELSIKMSPSRVRLEILWWSEALYSPSLDCGYRELDLPIAVVAAAVDLTQIVPALCPTSVSYILGETVLRLCQILETQGTQSIAWYLAQLRETKIKLGDVFHPVNTDEMRWTLLNLVTEALGGAEMSAEEIRTRTGLDSELELSAGEFAMWIFRDLQARRLVEEYS
jgi:hypothetical protein